MRDDVHVLLSRRELFAVHGVEAGFMPFSQIFGRMKLPFPEGFLHHHRAWNRGAPGPRDYARAKQALIGPSQKISQKFFS
jgi:hypothetical protein